MKRDRHSPDYEPVTRGAPGRRAPVEGEEESFTFIHSRAGEDVQTVAELPAASVTDSLTRGEEKSESKSAVAAAQSSADETEQVVKENWLKRRGHALSYAGLFLFTFVLYFRPYELIPALSSLTAMAYVLALATLIIYFPTQISLEGNLTARPREVHLLLLLCVLGLLSIPTAINPKEAWDTFNDAFVKAVLMFIVMINVVRTRWRLRGLLWLAIAVSVYLSVTALGDYRSGNLTVEGYRVAGAIGGMFGNPNDMALQLATIFPITIALMFTTGGPLRKIIYATCALLMVAAIVVTFSRGGFLALTGALVVLCWKIGRKHRLAVGLSLLLFLAGFFALAPGNYGDRVGSIFDHSADVMGSASMRQQLLIRSIIVAAKNPILGVGMGNFHIVSLRELVSHNAYTQVAAEMGIPAMIVYIMFMLTPFKRLRAIERKTFDTRRGSSFYYMSIGLQAALVAYMIGSFFASVAYLWYVYYLVGYAICLRRMYRVEEESNESIAAANEAAAAAETAREHERGQHSPSSLAGAVLR